MAPPPDPSRPSLTFLTTGEPFLPQDVQWRSRAELEDEEA
jgi:hypothetical protein